MKTKCRFCGSENAVRCGFRKNKHQRKQTYKCRDCKRRFTENDGFLKRKFSKKIITASLDLWAKGLSISKIRDHLIQFHDMKVACSTILNWLREYGGIIKKYTDELEYDFSDNWAIDEAVVRFNSHQNWLWNLLDQNKKFLISSQFSYGRWQEYSDKVLEEGKLKTKTNPEKIQSDGFIAYRSSIRKVFGNNTSHIRHLDLRSKINMNTVERVNGTCKDRIRPTRGFYTVPSANKIWNNWVIYYNFLKIHKSLGTTPARACGIDLKLEGNKWLSLINKSFNAHNNLVRDPE